MELLFKGGNELLKFVIDREKKVLECSNSKTNYQLQRMNYNSLFDSDKEQKIAEKWTNTQLILSISQRLYMNGYEIIRIENGISRSN